MEFKNARPNFRLILLGLYDKLHSWRNIFANIRPFQNYYDSPLNQRSFYCTISLDGCLAPQCFNFCTLSYWFMWGMIIFNFILCKNRVEGGSFSMHTPINNAMGAPKRKRKIYPVDSRGKYGNSGYMAPSRRYN